MGESRREGGGWEEEDGWKVFGLVIVFEVKFFIDREI